MARLVSQGPGDGLPPHGAAYDVATFLAQGSSSESVAGFETTEYVSGDVVRPA
jgi:hypothetical protein